MADEHMAGAEDDDVQFMRTVNNLPTFIHLKSFLLGRSSMLKLCACIRRKTYGFIGRSIRQSNVLS
jgi:hypothetical protein